MWNWRTNWKISRKNTHSITDVQSLVSMKVAGGSVGMCDIRKSYFIRAGIWKRQFLSKHYRNYILHSHHHYHSLIQSASRQPTVYFSLFVDFAFHLPSCKHFASICFHLTGNLLVLITHERIRSGRVQSYYRKFTSWIRPMVPVSNFRLFRSNDFYQFPTREQKSVTFESKYNYILKKRLSSSLH